MGTKPLKERKILVHDMKTEVYDKIMKLNWNNKHQKEQFMQSQILKGTISAIFCKKKHHKKIKQSYFKAYNTLYPFFQVNYS